MTHITADDLEIDTSEHDADPYEALAQSFDNAVARIAELEKQLATEREAKMHETERAQTLLKQFRAQQLFEAVAGKDIAEAIYAKYEQVEKERAAVRESRARLVRLISDARKFSSAKMQQQGLDIIQLEQRAERAEQDARALAEDLEFVRPQLIHLPVIADEIEESRPISAKYLKDGEQT